MRLFLFFFVFFRQVPCISKTVSCLKKHEILICAIDVNYSLGLTCMQFVYQGFASLCKNLLSEIQNVPFLTQKWCSRVVGTLLLHPSQQHHSCSFSASRTDENMYILKSVIIAYHCFIAGLVSLSAATKHPNVSRWFHSVDSEFEVTLFFFLFLNKSLDCRARFVFVSVFPSSHSRSYLCLETSTQCMSH